MNLYAFELGRKKELCFNELISVLGKENLVERNLDTAVFKLANFEPQSLQDSLGGTIKIIEIFAKPQRNELQSAIQHHLEENFKHHSGKIPFAISLLSYKNPREINIKDLLNYSKKILKSLGLNSRFVNKNFSNTKPSTIFKARVVEKGVDINIVKGNENIYLGNTIAIQNIDAYSKRDYDKPGRDAKVGMTPPKLAQIMINLAGPNSKTIYDPFCGTGTFLMEAMLMGKNAIGSDISPQMLELAEKNCTWFTQEFRTKSSFRLFERDARFLTKQLLPENIDAIITEGYLGKPQTSLPSQHEQEVIFRELANLHLNWLTAVHALTPKNCKIVMCIAGFRTPKGIEHLPKFREIAHTAGYKIDKFYTYDRPDQIVARDIAILVKK